MKDLRFAEKMKEYRNNLGITQKELAKRTHLAPATISAYENGVKSPTLDNAIAIADVLGISLDDLRGNSKTSFLTYSDVFNTILFFVDKLFARIEQREEGFGEEYDEFNALCFHNTAIDKMLGNIHDIKKALGNTEAEKELYELWKKSKSDEYAQYELFDQNSLTGINEIWNNSTKRNS